MSDYSSKNSLLLKHCLDYVNEKNHSFEIKECLALALKKAIKAEAKKAVAPLYSYLIAEDLGCGEEKWALQLTMACAYFYAAADLLDDIQDQDPHQPVLKKVSPKSKFYEKPNGLS